ncbi:MAG: septum formation initiator family protein [Deltaproteobacteria bacterium]|nr:MAG: septum formation initiator family protein [Deltaproteobacteria bacterium]
MKQVLFGILLLLVLTAFSNDGLFKYYHLKRFEKNLSQKNQKIEEENNSLKIEIKELQNPKTIEKHIRNTLGYVLDNELIFELSESKPSTPHIRFLGI